MKCKFVLDVDVDVTTLAEEAKSLVKWKSVRLQTTGKPRMEAYFPAGTVYDHPMANMFVDRGMAIPADAECEAACTPVSAEARQALEMSYQADVAGIHDPEDRKLFAAGVITGYQTIDGRAVYKPGPNYEAWRKAQEVAQASPDHEDLG